MGLCIYYRGRIKDAASLPDLIREVKDIANVYGWKYEIDEHSFPNNILDNQKILNLSMESVLHLLNARQFL